MTHPSHGSRAHAFFRRTYCALLPLLPSALRSRQGEAMLDLFEHELRRCAHDGAGGVWRAGVAGLADLAARGVYERVAEERRELTPANRATLGHTTLTFMATCTVLTSLFVAKAVATRASAPLHGSAFDAMLLSIPYTAALTIPMSVFIAVLWAGSCASSRASRAGLPVTHGALRLAPIIGMASAVALCCVILNAELVPRTNLRLQTMSAGDVAVTPSERSMTLRELRAAEAHLLAAPRHVETATFDAPSAASYAVEIHKKFALSAASVVLALLALGLATWASRITLPARVAISLLVFAGYYVCVIVGEQLADRSAIPPALAMWSANLIVLLLAVLTLRVAPKEQLMDADGAVPLPRRRA